MSAEKYFDKHIHHAAQRLGFGQDFENVVNHLVTLVGTYETAHLIAKAAQVYLAWEITSENHQPESGRS